MLSPPKKKCVGAGESVARAEKLNQVMQKKKSKVVALRRGKEHFIWLQN
jgi:hypothetical protein